MAAPPPHDDDTTELRPSSSKSLRRERNMEISRNKVDVAKAPCWLLLLGLVVGPWLL